MTDMSKLYKKIEDCDFIFTDPRQEALDAEAQNSLDLLRDRFELWKYTATEERKRGQKLGVAVTQLAALAACECSLTGVGTVTQHDSQCPMGRAAEIVKALKQ